MIENDNFLPIANAGCSKRETGYFAARKRADCPELRDSNIYFFTAEYYLLSHLIPYVTRMNFVGVTFTMSCMLNGSIPNCTNKTASQSSVRDTAGFGILK